MKSTSTILILIANTLFLFGAIEIAGHLYLKNKGISTRLFINLNRKTQGALAHGKFKALDPHLGYAHANNEQAVKDVNKDYTWVDGFLIYEKDVTDIRKLPSPVILTLGGSTTDGIIYGHSWPEHLARAMRAKGIKGTVVNGGTGGYSTNQELLKLLRDGLEFNPQLVISYSGVNDRGDYSLLPNPMVHTYQRDLLHAMTTTPEPGFLPNTLQALRLLSGKKGDLDFSLGVGTTRTLAQQYERNLRLMNAISQANGSKFIGFIQPCGYFGNALEPGAGKSNIYRQKIRELYEDLVKIAPRISYLRDATKILDGHPEVYKSDYVHLEENGDKMIADYILKEISPLLNW